MSPAMLAVFMTAVVHKLASTRQRDPDASLVEAMAKGDSGEALTKFYELYAGRALAILIRMMPTRADAEEILQEIITELWQKAGQFDASRGSVAAWVATVTRSRALDALRARRSRGGGKQVDLDALQGAFDDAPSPDSLAAMSQEQQAVRVALGKLNDDQRHAIELAYFGGLSHREIAERTGAPLGTVKSRIISAMKTLRGALAGVHAGEVT